MSSVLSFDHESRGTEQPVDAAVDEAVRGGAGSGGGDGGDGGDDDDRDDDDLDVLEALEREDFRGALKLLMQRYGTSVYRYLRVQLRDATLAEDVQQRVFIEAYRDLPKFQRRSKVRTWLYQIARHRMLDATKARKRAEAHLVEDDAMAVPDPGPSACEQLDDGRFREALLACLEKLPEHIRTAVQMRYQLGLSFEEMAEILKEKPGTLQARVARALPVLRACIQARTGGKV